MLAELHRCQHAAALEAVISASCLETLGLDMVGDMNKLGYTGQNSHAWDASSCPMSAGQRAKRTITGSIL